MSRTSFIGTSRRIETEKTAKRLGAASVKFDVLDFPYSKALDRANVERLKRLFVGSGGCAPDELLNHIPAIISESQLHDVLRFSEKSRDQLLNSGSYVRLELPPGLRLRCLRGRHRVRAADEVLRGIDKRWVVDFYLTDISQNVKSALIDEYTNEKTPDDGEFYWKIREYQGVFGHANPYFERRWWARLAAASTSTNKKDCLSRLFGHQDFARAFDSFQYLPALYCGMRLSAIKKMIALRCKETLAFLQHIKDFFYYVFNGDIDMMRKLTRADVEAVQLKAPGAFPADATSLFGRVRSGEIFGAFNEQEREVIWTRLRDASTDFLIPSLFAFFENLKYLQGPANCMKRLVQLRNKETICLAMQDAYADAETPTDGCFIQVSSNTFKFAPNVSDPFDIVYRQQWLYAIREYRAMPAKSRKKLAQPGSSQANEAVLFEFASLADKQGLKTEEIQTILRRDPDRELARRLLLSARDPDRYRYNDVEVMITQVTNAISTARLREDEGLEDPKDAELPVAPKRCGLPNDLDQRRDKSLMFLDKLHSPLEGQGSTVTSFFVQRSIYFAFFGKDVEATFGELRNLGENQFDIFGQIQRSRALETLPRSLEFPLHQAHTRIDELAREERESSERLRTTRQEVLELEARVTVLVEKRQEQQTSIDNLDTAVLTKANKLEQLKQEEATRLGTLRTLQAEEQDFQRKIRELQSTQQTLEEGFRIEERLQERLRQLKVQEVEQQKRLNDGELSVQRLEARERGLTTRISNLVTEENDRRCRTEQLSEKLGVEEVVQQRLDELGKQMEARDVRIAQLATEESAIQSRIEQFLERSRAMEAEQAERQGRLDKLAAAESEKMSSLKQLEAQLAGEETSIRSKIAQLSENFKAMEFEEASRQKRLNDLAAAESEKMLSLEQLQARQLELTTKVSDMVAEEDSLRSKTDQLCKELEAIGIAKAEQQQVLEYDKPRVAKLTAHIQQLTEKEDKLEKRVERLTSLNQQRQESINMLTEQLEQLKADERQHQLAIVETEDSQPGTPQSGKVQIIFRELHIVRSWRVFHRLFIDPADPGPLQRMVAKKLQAKCGVFDKNLRSLNSESCKRVISDESLSRSIYCTNNWEVEAGVLRPYPSDNNGKDEKLAKRSRG